MTGNKIPAKWYAEWQRKHGFGRKPLHDEMPAWMQKAIEKEFGP